MPAHHDAPINRLDEDALDRKGFAQRAAASLFAAGRNKESLAVAMCGNWGEGKTSTKNLIHAASEAQARAAGKAAPNWVEFSPWQVNGLPGIEKLFFEEIGNAIGKAPGKGSAADRAKTWRKFGNTVQALGTIAEHAGKVAGLFVPGASVAGELIGGAAKKASEASAFAADSLEDEEPKDSLSFQKLKLRQMMLKLDSQIVVVIDDMDRLGDDEILLVLRLIRANADLPNLTYLLLFQRDVVERAINRQTREDGSAYLEKFVQVFLELPRPDIAKVHRAVTSGLTDLVNRLGIQWTRFDHERWANLWHPGLSHMFRTLRDAHRYLNVVEFRMAGLVTRGVPEVNLLDVFALECLRLFEPAVHRALLADPNLFLHSVEYSQRTPKIDALDKIKALASEDRQDAVTAILTAVFPAAKGAYSNTSYDASFYARWEAEARVCSERIFHRFYAGELQEDSISEADISDLLAVKDDRGKCARLIQKQLKRKNTAMQFLERLRREPCFSKGKASQPLRLAVWDTSDEFPPKSGTVGINSNDPASIPYWILADALRRLESVDAKRELVIDTMMKSRSLLAFIWTANGCEKRHEKVHFWPQLSESDLARIKAEALARLENAATQGKMIRSPHLTYLLWGWRRLETERVQKQVRQWLQKAPKADVLNLLRSFVSRGSSWGMESYYIKEHVRIVWDDLADFASLDEWQSAVKRVSGRRVSKKVPEEVTFFNEAVKRSKSGKSDRGGRLMDEESDEDEM